MEVMAVRGIRSASGKSGLSRRGFGVRVLGSKVWVYGTSLREYPRFTVEGSGVEHDRLQ